jgi:MFS family permease
MWAIGALAYGVTIIQRTSFGVAGLQAAERFSIGPSLLSVFVFMQILVYASCQLPVGLALDRWGARHVLAAGALTVGLGQLILATTSALPLAFLGRGIVGLGDAATFIGAVRLVNFWFPSHHIPLMTQLTQMTGAAGQIFTALPFASLLITRGWTTSFVVLGVAGIAMAALIFTLVSNAPPGEEESISPPSASNLIAHVRETWAHPGTRLGFWTHFVSPASSATYALLWGFPFLIRGQGRTPVEAGWLLSTTVILGVVVGPVLAGLISRFPLRRSRLTLYIVGITAVAWTAVLIRPAPSPLWLLLLLSAALALGGPGSMIGLDHARSWNPRNRLGAAQGLVNSGGFFAAVLLIALIGAVLQLVGEYSLDAFRLAFAVQYPVWALGAFNIIRYRRKVRALRAAEDAADTMD